MIARLRTWWAASPRARRLPGALILPAVLTLFGTLLTLAATGLFHWLFLAFALLGGGFGIYTTLLVLTGRDAL
jgi:hypothetical protein